MTATICRADVPDGPTGRGCGHPIEPGEEHRCLDCEAVMHRDCLRQHVADVERVSASIYAFQCLDCSATGLSRWQYGRMLLEPACSCGGPYWVWCVGRADAVEP